ncbi:MAG TPA: PilZ domain-containing protein [Vicinamibacterales bacterium]|nr:PilZ domain-containing protein [Vicinamibacterales bacterium]
MSSQPNDHGKPDPARPTAPEASPAEDPRHPASDVPAIKAVRISPPRTDAVLINISAGGILAECGTRFQPGVRVTVGFVGEFLPASVTGRVARSSIARIGPEGVRYHVGIAFSAKIPLPDRPPAADTNATAAAEAAPEATSADAGDARPRVNRW